MFDAVVFDFDGLILDTETPLYDAWRLTFEHYGVEPIPIDEWAQSMGRADGDPLILNPVDRLAEARDRHESEAEIQTRRDVSLQSTSGFTSAGQPRTHA